MNPLVSIIVPVYNVELYLKQCLDSIINQTYKNLEIILIDDGSTDNSGAICDEYASKDKRIKVIHKENGGLSSARNAGLEIYKGDYVGFVDSDDWIEKDMYESLLDAIIKYDCDISMCGSDSVYDDGTRITCGQKPAVIKGYEKAFLYNGSNEIIEAHLLDRNGINSGVWNKLYKKTIIGDIRFPEGMLFEDIATTYRLLSRANNLVNIYSHKYNYRVREGSIINKKFSQKNFDALIAGRERYDFIKNRFPLLERQARRRFLIDFLFVAYKVSADNKNKEFLAKLKMFIKQNKDLSIFKCSLSKKQIIRLLILKTCLPLFCFITKAKKR